MRKLTVFNQISLDGYFVDENGDMSWAKANQDAEWLEFVEGNASGGGTLVFGRITYDMMASYWPSQAAVESMPVVAERMNNLPKVVFSKTMEKASWHNTRLVKSDLATEVRKMKQEPGEGMVIMGSGTIVAQLTEHRLIDAYQLVIVPIVLGEGRTMFEGVKERPKMKRTETRVFGNGNVFVCYEPAT